MQNDSWRYVAIDSDGGVTMYKDLPERYGDNIAVCDPGDFPKSGKLRLTSNKQGAIKIVLMKTTSGYFCIKRGGVNYRGYQKAPCVITLPQPIVARGKFFRVGV